MINPNIPYDILLQVENKAAFESLAQELLANFPPQTQPQCQLFEEMLTAAWLRRRYENVRSSLFAEKRNLLGQAAPSTARQQRLDHLDRSIQSFQREVERQKKTLADSRRLLRRSQEYFHYRQDSELPLAA